MKRFFSMLLILALALGLCAGAAAEEAAVALTIGERDYSLGEMNYHFSTEYYRFVESFGAYVSLLGLDTSGYSFGYVASWAVGKTDEEMHQCLQVVRDAAKAMVEDLQAAMAA